MPTSKDLAYLESDRVVAREKKLDINEFDIIDAKTQYTIQIRTKTLIVLRD